MKHPPLHAEVPAEKSTVRAETPTHCGVFHAEIPTHFLYGVLYLSSYRNPFEKDEDFLLTG
jgi:hypothetical protein